MRRSVFLLLMGLELAVLGIWYGSVRFEGGLDALQYHRMANAIVHGGSAPWAFNALSYIGIYPGSDSSAVPFLAASYSLLAGCPVSAAVLAYDVTLLLVFGLGLFALTRRVTNDSSLALLAVPLGSLAYGIITTLSWGLDERAFNVALAPAFLFLVIPRGNTHAWRIRGKDWLALGLMSCLMLAAHLSFLLLVPFLFVVPLVYQVVEYQRTGRRKRFASLAYFGAVAVSPLILLTVLNQLGLLASFGLEYQLESSALFSGDSAPIFLLNALVFLGTRVGPAILACAAVGIIFLASRRNLLSKDIAIGGLLLAGFLVLPIVLYSKDILTPVLVIVGAVGLGGMLARFRQRRNGALAVCVVLVISSSITFNAWNGARTGASAAIQYRAPLVVTPESQSGNLWIANYRTPGGCVYGNNPVLLQQVTTQPGQLYCTGLAVDYVLNQAAYYAPSRPTFQVTFKGIISVSPSDWFTSPDLERVSEDFARLPSLDYAAGQALLLRYRISLVVVDLQMPYDIPQYNYQGTQSSLFFRDLWATLYPVYQSSEFAVFRVG